MVAGLQVKVLQNNKNGYIFDILFVMIFLLGILVLIFEILIFDSQWLLIIFAVIIVFSLPFIILGEEDEGK